MPKEKEPKNELILRNRLKEARAEQNLSQSQLAESDSFSMFIY